MAKLHSPSVRILLLSSLLVLPLAACEGGFVGGNQCQGSTCPQDPQDPQDPWDPTNPSNPSNPTNPSNPSNPTNPPTPNCTQDADCLTPYVCHVKAGKCVPPSAKDNGTCNPIEGQGCEGAMQCINGVCMNPLGTCANNDNCPAGFLCQNGVCTPDNGGGVPGCLDNNQCPAGQVCVAGQCKPQAVCTIPHAQDRLAGMWEFDSKLKVRDGLQGLTKGVLGVASTMQSIIDGKFTISGVPSFLTAVIGGIVQNLINQYVPPWGKQIIQWLANVNDAIDDWRIVSLEQLQPVGGDQYVGSSKWTLVEFQYQGAMVSANPASIPGIGEVVLKGWTAREVCGTLIIDKHNVQNKVGQIFRWAIEALLTAITCSRSDMPCFKTLDQMFNAVIDCNALGNAVASADSTIPGISALVAGACAAEKGNLTKMLIQALDDLSAKLTYMSLAAKADIANNSLSLANGRWYGTLGGTYGGGNFEGNFTAVKK